MSGVCELAIWISGSINGLRVWLDEVVM